MEGLCLSESVKKGKIVTEVLFLNNAQWTSDLWKTMTADVNAKIKQQEIKDLVVYLTNAYKR